MAAQAYVLLSAALELVGEALPSEFRIFKRGWNETTKGNLLFDDAAAKAVMAQYTREGVDLIVDLNHDSMNPKALASRQDAGDARAWYQLELRAGELWGVNVKWTPDGARRLTEKTQRYISPVALYDADSKRVEYVANVALCAMPATLDAAPLVAASKSPSCTRRQRMQRFDRMSPELLKKILDAIAAGDDKSGLLAEIVAGVAAEEAGEPAGGADPMAAAAETPPADPNAPPKPAVAAAKATETLSPIAKALGCATEEDAAKAVLKLQKQVQAQADAADAVELETRRGLIAELVKLGIEKPAYAWKGDADKRQPADRLMVEPIAGMRARVELHKADGPRTPAEPPATSESGVIALSKTELAYCKANDMTPAQFEAKKQASAKVAK